MDSSFANSIFESGGLLGSRNNDVIDIFYYDKGKEEKTDEYIPNIDALQQQLLNWNTEGIMFRGIIHSHLKRGDLSSKDVCMARKILSMNHLTSILMPVYIIREKNILWHEVNNDGVIHLETMPIQSGGDIYGKQ